MYIVQCTVGNFLLHVVNGIICLLIPTKLIYCCFKGRILQSTQRGLYVFSVVTANKFYLVRTIAGDSKLMVAVIVLFIM